MNDNGFPTLAILPWLKLDERVTLGNVDFIPWKLAGGSADSLSISDEDVSKVMSSYVDIDGKPVQNATIAVHNSAKESGLLAEDKVDEITAAAQCLTFAAIADNDYFCQLGKYANASCFAVIFQRINTDGGIALTLKRRSGYLLDAGHSHGEVRFTIPQQCRNIGDIKPEKDLVDAMTVVLMDKTPFHRRLLRSIRLLTLAYTDDGFMPQDQEAILLMMAFEGLFKNCQGRNDLACKVSTVIDEYGTITIDESRRLAKAPRGLHPEMWLHRAWVLECYGLRSDYVHGNKVGEENMAWSPFEHVVFASWLFPLLVKRLLASEGTYPLSRQDSGSLTAVDVLLDSTDWPGGPRNQTNWQWAQERGREEFQRQEMIRHLHEYDIIQNDGNENEHGQEGVTS